MKKVDIDFKNLENIKQRFYVKDIQDFLTRHFKRPNDTVVIIDGLYGTGKTTLMQQLAQAYKNNLEFKDKIVVGTSLGAMSALYLGDLDLKENLLHLSKIISICPPYDLTYAISEIDKTTEIENQENLKEKITLTSAKIMNGIEEKEEM